MPAQTNISINRPRDNWRTILISTILLFIILAGLLIRMDFINFRDTIIAQNQQESLDTAKAAARGIETYFRNIVTDLHSFSRNEVHSGEVPMGALHNELLKNFRGKAFQKTIRAIGSETNYSMASLGIINTDGIMKINVIDSPLFKEHFVNQDFLNSDSELKKRLFEIPKMTGKLFLSNLDRNSEGDRFWMSYPIHYHDQWFRGVAVAGIDPTEVFDRFITPINEGITKVAWVLDSKGVIQSHPHPELIGKNISDIINKSILSETDLETFSKIIDKINRGYEGTGAYPSIFKNPADPEPKIMFTAFAPAHMGNQLWAIGVSMDYSEISEPIYKHLRNMTLIAGLFVLLLGTGGYAYYRKQKREALLEAEAANLKIIAESAEALKESEEKYRFIVENAKDIIYQTDQYGYFTYCNKVTSDTTGYTNKELMKRYYLDLVHPEHREEVKNFYTEQFKNKIISTNFELPILTKTGQTVWLEPHTQIIQEDGDIISTHVISRDITERKHFEEKLRQSEMRYRTLFEHAGFDITLFDAKTGERIEFNRIAHESLGYTHEEFKTLSAADLDAFQNQDEVKKRMAEMVDQGSTVFETQHKAKNGELRYGLVSSVPFNMEGKNFIQSIRVDITQRKKAEMALKDSEARFRRLVEYIPDALFLHDMEGRILDANHIASENLGYTKEELLNIRIQDLEHTFISKKHAENWKQMTQNIPVTVEGIQRRKDGSTFPVDIRIWIFESGANQLMLALVRDITGRKLAVKEKKRLESQLAHAQKMQSIGTLAGGIAHNFNNLLMGIQGNVSLIQFNKKPDNPDNDKLSSIHELVEKGAKLTGQLLGYAREGKYEIKPIDLDRLVRETADTFSAARKDLILRHCSQKDLHRVRADQGQIQQALLNLYLNAGDAMPNGGEIFLSTANVTDRDIINKSYNPVPGDYVLLTVRDTGEGIEDDIMERIFEPFFTTKGLAKGTGLGLASVYGIIKGHKGYIDVVSEKGEGTSFHIYLPATRAVMEKKTSPSDLAHKGKETILLVDDEPIITETASQMLDILGYEVITASGGQEAVKIYKKHKGKIDMILLDMVMPDMNGGETYDQIKEINSRVKVLLSSGYTIDGKAQDILNRGCNGFIQKPFSMSKLSTTIRSILDTGVS